MKKVGIFWPGDYRAQPNEWARPQAVETTRQLEQALRKLGRTPYVVEGFLTRPDQAIRQLGPIDDPLVGVFVHWAYAPHTCDGVAGNLAPLTGAAGGRVLGHIVPGDTRHWGRCSTWLAEQAGDYSRGNRAA